MIDVRRKAKRRLRVGDPDFQPPDGGWGWLVVFAAGFTTLCVISLFQQFGLIFRKRFAELGISQIETTTIINVGAAMYSGVGFANGPLFRRFTYRQVSLVGSVCVVLSTLACIFCSTFWSYIFCYSIIYGTAFGIVQSAVGLALNTYFKEKRRIATGFSWTVTALGPVIWPYMVVASNEYYGITGTLLLFAGVAMHGVVLSLLLQPVHWHTKFREDYCAQPEKGPLLQNNDSKKIRRIHSQTQEMICNALGDSYEVIGIPIFASIDDLHSRSRRASKHSLQSHGLLKNQVSGELSKPSSFVDLTESDEAQYATDSLEKKSTPGREEDPLISETVSPDIVIKATDGAVVEIENGNKIPDTKIIESLSIWKRISLFFDFELFKDFVYVNIMVGVTIASFVEINFSILTPIILKEFNFPEIDVATFMSLLGTTDIIFRFTIPFIADKIGWSNRTFFLIGVMSMAFARIVLIHTQTYYVALLVAVILGVGKAFRTIFMALVIPSHVPLERLPAASGLQLAFGGLVFIILGPMIGLIRQLVGNYVITLHLLNICTYTTAILWITEFIITSRRNKKAEESKSKN